MSKTRPLDSDLAQYSIAARAVLDLKKPVQRLGDLMLYTAAAGSALALAPAAEAAIIYSGPQNITVNGVTTGPGLTLVDLNGDGKDDIIFGVSNFAFSNFQVNSAFLAGIATSGQYGSIRFFNNTGDQSLLKLAASSRTIDAYYGPRTRLSSFGLMRRHAIHSSIDSFFGLWSNDSTGFAGVVIDSYNNAPVNQFGWLHLKLTIGSLNRANSLTLIDWAFQSVSGVGIHVGDKGATSMPEPSTLGLLALGAAGLAALRRRRGQEKEAEWVD